MSDFRYFQINDRSGVMVLRLQAVNLDRTAANELGADLVALLDQHRACRVVINLADVTKISSPVLAQLMAFDKRIKASGGRLLMCDAAPGVHQIISLAWPGRSAEEPATEDAAVAELDAWQPANEG
jgi:anti-anti-sigma factor